MLKDTPNESDIRQRGHFLGYYGYDEVFKFEDSNWILLDYLTKDGTLKYHVHKHYVKGGLVKGYREGWGENYIGEPYQYQQKVFEQRTT